MDGDPRADVGVWESGPGRFPRTVQAGEVMHILAGEATFTTADGETIAIGAGDTLIFSPDTRGEWQVLTTLRKFYVML